MSLTLDRPRPTQPPATTDWTHLLEQIAADTWLVDDGFHLSGQDVPVTTQPGHGRRDSVAAALTHALYQRYYHHHATPHLCQLPDRQVDRRPASAREDADFGQQLRAHLGLRSYWDPGWQVLGSSSSGHILVERDDLVLHALPSDVHTGPTGTQVRFPADRPWASTGYYVVTSTHGPVSRLAGLARCYLHLQPASAPAAFAHLVSSLDELAIPFTAKVLNDPRAFGRPDSAVVYPNREHLPAVAQVALDLHHTRPGSIGRTVPAFTRPIGPGVGIADDPGPGLSFGQHRCCAIAAGIVAAGPTASPHARLTAITDTLSREGLDLQALHLNPGHPEFDLFQG